MTLLDYGLPLASFAGSGLAYYFASRAKGDADSSWRAYDATDSVCENAEAVAQDAVVKCGTAVMSCTRLAKVCSNAAGLCHDAATQTAANTDAVDDAAVRLLDDSDVFGDGYFRKPDDTAELAVMPPEVCS